MKFLPSVGNAKFDVACNNTCSRIDNCHVSFGTITNDISSLDMRMCFLYTVVKELCAN